MSNTIKKPTKRENFEALAAIPEVASSPELVKFINREIELLNKKSKSNGELTPEQKENEEIKQTILNFLENNAEKMFTISEIQKAIADNYPDLTNQKVSSLVRYMKTDNLVERIEDKRKAYFRYLEVEG